MLDLLKNGNDMQEWWNTDLAKYNKKYGIDGREEYKNRLRDARIHKAATSISAVPKMRSKEINKLIDDCLHRGMSVSDIHDLIPDLGYVAVSSRVQRIRNDSHPKVVNKSAKREVDIDKAWKLKQQGVAVDIIASKLGRSRKGIFALITEYKKRHGLEIQKQPDHKNNTQLRDKAFSMMQMGVSKREAARRLGVSPRTITRWQNQE